MGQTSGKLDDAAAQKRMMEVQRQYVNVRMEAVDFENPTGADDDKEEEEDAPDAAGAGDAAQTVEEDVTYERYKPAKLVVKHARPHPSHAVENGTLATVAPPDVTYKLRIETERPEVVREGRLSDLQLEFVTSFRRADLLKMRRRRGRDVDSPSAVGRRRGSAVDGSRRTPRPRRG